MNFRFLDSDLKDMPRRHFLTWPIYLSSESAQKLTSRCGLQKSLVLFTFVVSAWYCYPETLFSPSLCCCSKWFWVAYYISYEYVFWWIFTLSTLCAPPLCWWTTSATLCPCFHLCCWSKCFYLVVVCPLSRLYALNLLQQIQNTNKSESPPKVKIFFQEIIFKKLDLFLCLTLLVSFEVSWNCFILAWYSYF